MRGRPGVHRTRHASVEVPNLANQIHEPLAPFLSLIRASVLDGDPAEEAWREWRLRHDVRDDDSAFHALLPAVARNLSPETLGDDQATVAGMWKRSWYLNTVRLKSASGAIDVLGAAGIRSALCKGGALIVDGYRDAGSRSMADVDVLVDFANHEAAVSLLLAHGWRLKGRMRARATNHDCGLLDESGHTVEIHRWVSFPRCAAHPDDVTLLGRRRTAPGLPILDPADSLVIAVALNAGMHSPTALTWPLDVVVLAHSHRDDVTFWPRVVQSARELGQGWLLGPALDYCRDVVGADPGHPDLTYLEDDLPPRRILAQRRMLNAGDRSGVLLATLYATVFLGTRRLPNPWMDIRNKMHTMRHARHDS